MRKAQSTKALENAIRRHGNVGTIHAMIRILSADIALSQRLFLHDRARELETLLKSLDCAKENYVHGLIERYKLKNGV